jgi:sporulation protein YlmC with PRC-barrel domain
MKRDGYLKLVGEVRDLQIVDASGRRCGIADDIEFEGQVGKPLKVKALLVGPGAYGKRLPRWVNSIIKALVGQHFVRVPWKDVVRITAVIELAKDAEAYGLGVKDIEWEKRLSRIPGACS